MTRNNHLQKSNNQPQEKTPVNWRFQFFSALIVIGLSMACFSLYSTVSSYHENQSLLADLEEQYLQAQDDLTTLKEHKNYVLETDYLAQLARKDYLYSKPDEIIFKLEGDTQ